MKAPKESLAKMEKRSCSTNKPAEDGEPYYWYNEEIFDEVYDRGVKAGGESYDFDRFGALWEVAKMVTEREVKICALENRNKELEKALRIANEYIIDPDSFLGLNFGTSVYTPPLTSEQQLQKEINRIKKLKEDKKIVTEALF